MDQKKLNRWISNACSYRAQRAIHELRISRSFPFPGKTSLTSDDIKKLERAIEIYLEQEYIFDVLCSSVENGELIKRRYLDNDRSVTGQLVTAGKRKAIRYLNQLIKSGAIEPLLYKDTPLLFRSSHGGVNKYFDAMQ